MDRNRRIETWIRQHPILFAVLCGAAGFGLAAWARTPKEETIFHLLGWGAFAVAGFIAQERYLLRTCYRDLRRARKADLDSAFVVENTGAGWAAGRDLRETLHGGEIVLAILGAVALGAIASAFAVGFFFTAAAGADNLSGPNSTWSNVIMWAAGVIAALFSLVVLIDEPLNALRYWFASRRLIEREHLDALKILAAAASRDS
jgi:hypothetical protein